MPTITTYIPRAFGSVIVRTSASLSVTMAGRGTITGTHDGFASGGIITSQTSAGFNAIVDSLKARGAQWLRTKFSWWYIQDGSPTTWNWAPFDNAVSYCASVGINIVANFHEVPTWALPSGCISNTTCPPNNISDFTTFVTAVVNRYKANVHYWEIINEPNGWYPVASYTSLLIATYTAIKAADPTATVLTGGMEPAATGGSSYSPCDWLTGIYANGGGGSFDIVAHHPYCYNGPGTVFPFYATWSAWSQMADTPINLRSIMVANGDAAKPIWATEFGAPTAGGSTAITEAQQAQLVIDAYALFHSYPWAGKLFWYEYQDIGTDTSTVENFFGIVRYDGSAKPAFSTYTVLQLTTSLTTILAGIGTCGATISLGVLSLYGSNVMASLSTAGKAGTTLGGTEVAAVTTAPASGSGYVECFALGGTSTVNAALPAPSGKGWLLDLPLLEGQRLIAGPWGASVAVSDANGGGPVTSYTLRFWQRSSGGTYAAIGSLVLSASQVISTVRAVKAFLAAAMPQTDFAVGDKLYIDFFINANGWASDVLSVYVSNSGAAGVAGDLEVDTAGYIPSGTAGVVTSYIPRALSALLVVTSTALLDTLTGTGTLTGTISALSVALSITFSGGGVLSGQVTANLALPATTLAGASSFAGLPSLATNLAISQFAGSSTLSASVLARTVLTSQFTGVGTLASSFQLATSLTGQLAGVDILSATITANLALPGIVLAGGGTLAGTLSTSTLTPVALVATMVGGGTLTGTLAFATQFTGTPAGVSTLAATMTASTTLASTTLPGSGALIGVTARGTTLSTTTLIGTSTLGASLLAALTLSGTSWAGVGALSATLTGAGGLVGTLFGGGTLAASLSAKLTLIGASFAGVGVLSATVQASTVLSATLSGGSTLSGVPSARTALGVTLAGASTLTGTTVLSTALIGTVPGAGTLAGAAGRSTALNVALPGSGQLAAVGSAQITLTSSFSGIGTAAFTLFLKTSLSITLSGAGNMTSASMSYRVALALSLAGVASLSGSLTVPVLAYLSATWKTRDGQAVWVTRDEKEATWVTRDGQVVWKIRS